MAGIWVILTWMDIVELSDLSLALNKYGKPILFDSDREAKKYADKDYQNCKIVQI